MGPKLCRITDATEVTAIVTEKRYQTSSKLTHNPTGMTKTIFILFLFQYLLEIYDVSLLMTILANIGRKAAHAFYIVFGGHPSAHGNRILSVLCPLCPFCDFVLCEAGKCFPA